MTMFPATAQRCRVHAVTCKDLGALLVYSCLSSLISRFKWMAQKGYQESYRV